MNSEDQDNLKMLRKINNQSVVEVQHENSISEHSVQKISLANNQQLTKSKDEQQHQNCDNPRHDHKNHNHNSHKGHHHGTPGKKNYCIIFYCIFTCLSCLYLETEVLNPLLNDTKSKLMSYFCYFNVFMCLFSYFQTMRTKSTVKKLKGIYHLQTKDEKLYDKSYDLYSKKCEKCDYYKFPRVSHCSTCGECIYKLDHHCIWTQTCIGYRNQRPFYLFCFYMTLGVFQFWYSSIRVSSQLIGTCAFFSAFEPGVYILWIITCFSAGLVGLMIVGLCITHTFMVITNFTTLDSIKFKKMCEIPFCEMRKQYFTQPNIFNRGEIQNLKSLFGTNILTCWLPLPRQIENQFIFEAMNPYPCKLELMKFSDLYKEQINYQKEVEKYTIGFKGIYKGKKMKFNNQIYEL